MTSASGGSALLPRQHPHEEFANSVTHGLGVVLSVAALTAMVSLAGLRGSAWEVVGSAVFGSSGDGEASVLALASDLISRVDSAKLEVWYEGDAIRLKSQVCFAAD